MNMLQRLVILAGMVTIAGCAATDSRAVEVAELMDEPAAVAATGIKPFKVRLKVEEDDNGELLLKVKNPETSAGCDKFPEKDQYGCIVAALNETVEIEVTLIGSPDWHLDAFQICAQLQKPDFTAEAVCDLPDKERADWLVLANNNVALPDKNGRVDLSQFEFFPLAQFVIRDMNWTRASYFYGVRACKNDDKNACLWTDPGGENNGRGWVSGSN